MKHMLTVLRARAQQVDDVLVFPDHLHHLHLGDQVGQILLCGVRCTQQASRYGKQSL